MERIKKALEKARQEREIRQGGETAPATRADSEPTGARQTQSLAVVEKILR